jgi:hypothetical protein
MAIPRDGGIFENHKTPITQLRSGTDRAYIDADGNRVDEGIFQRYSQAITTPGGRNAIAMEGKWQETSDKVLASLPQAQRWEFNHRVGSAARDAYTAALASGKTEREAQMAGEAVFQKEMASAAQQARVPYEPATVVTPTDDPVNPEAAYSQSLTQKAQADSLANVRDLRDKLLDERKTSSVGEAQRAPVIVAPKADQTQSNETRGYQMEGIRQLRDASMGLGPSVAQEQLRAQNLGIEQNTLGIAAGGDAGSRRMATRSISDQKRAAGIDSSLLRAQEITDARTGLTNASGQARGQDITGANADADRLQSANETNAGNALKNREIGVQERQGLGELALSAQGQETQTALVTAQIEQIKGEIAALKARIGLEQDAAKRQALQQEYDNKIKLLAALFQGVGSVGSMALGK